MRRVACLAATMCAISCYGENPKSVRTIVEHHESNRLVDTKLGTLTIANQSWGFQKQVVDDRQPLEMFYRAEVSIELAEKAEGLEVWIPYEISVHTSSRGKAGSGRQASEGELEPDALLRGLALTNSTSFRDSLLRNPLLRTIPRIDPTEGPEGMSASMGFNPPRVILTPDAPWMEARATIDIARPVRDPVSATLLDSLSINFRELLLLPAGTMDRAHSQ